MDAQFIAATRNYLTQHAKLADKRAAALAEVARECVFALPERRCVTIAISGAPGTGKSTLARACAAGLQALDARPFTLSLDDYYLPLAARRQLATRVHPLLGQRGAPGTHEIELLSGHLAALRAAEHGPLEIPRFDKSLDDRAAGTRTIPAGASFTHLLLEGWLVGVPPEDPSRLAEPVNDTERRQDPDGRWRRWTHGQLEHYHQGLAPLIDAHWHLDAPDWDCVVDWRWRQEQVREVQFLEDREAVRRFLEAYQRIGLHMHRSCARWADVVVTLDRDHHPHTRRCS